MVSVDSFELALLPCISFEDRYSLPESSGIYIALRDGEGILYIGKSGNLRRRLYRHEHASLFDYLGSVRLAYLEIDPEQSASLEVELIRRFKPELNRNHIPVERPESLPMPKPVRSFWDDTTRTKMLTVKEAASNLGKSEQTIRTWLKRGRFPGAKLEETPLGSYWLIPAKSVDDFTLRKAGRPAKPKTKAEKGKGN